MRDSYLVGFLGALFAGLIGLSGRLRRRMAGGLLDEILQMFTNIVIMMPALVLLLVIGAYFKTHSVFLRASSSVPPRGRGWPGR